MNILLSGSGSGGHIYPCIATYQELKENHKVYLIIFKQIDKKIYDLNHLPYIYINDEYSSLKKLKEIKKVFKENNIQKVLTFGGKNSLYIQLISKKQKIDHYIFEQNAIMGKANKINYLFCKKVFTNFKLNLKKEIQIGNPNAFKIKKEKLNLFKERKITILFTMGSLGSSSVDKVIQEFILKNKDYNIIYVCGKNVNSKIKNSKNVQIFDYYNPLSTLIYNADLIVSRAGASTMAEIIALNKVSIFIPSPYVSDNHQYKNAKVLYNQNACAMILEKDLSYDILLSKIRNLTHDADQFKKMKHQLQQFNLQNNFNVIRKEIEK